MKYTAQQQRAISAGGDSLLVSAAAGSGKTAVLVQRVIDKVLRGGEIEGMWIMTFTEAAAAEMRVKIEQAIEKELERDPDSDHLHRQFLAVSRANISTVHSACARLLKANFEAAGIDPSARVGDETVIKVAFETLLEDFVEEIYDRTGTDAAVRRMVECYSGGRNDVRLFDILRAAYTYYENQPFPEEFIPPRTEDLDHLIREGYVRAEILDRVEWAHGFYQYLLNDEKTLPLRKTKLWGNLEIESFGVRRLLDAARSATFDEIRKAALEIRFARWNTRGKDYDDMRDLLAELNIKRKAAKNAIEKITEKYFQKTEREHLSDVRRMEDALETLFSLTREFDERFAAYKKDKGLMSFNDLERFSLRLLIDRYDAAAGTLYPSDTARALREEIDEIIVDEYQDTNRKQDLIFRALSKDGKNIFMVGDIKQSIYGFRQACPELFTEKKEAAREAAGDRLGGPSYLYLNRNFRSHPELLDFINTVFGGLMTEDLGQVAYDENERLASGGLYPETSRGQVGIDIILRQAADDEDDDENGEEDEIGLLSAIDAEAEYVARKAKSVRGTPFYDVKTGRERPIEYGDMAILSRNANAMSARFEQALGRNGIRCINHNRNERLLELWEVQMLRAFLQVVSNPYRDIPLITLMYSDFYVFSAAELAAIRAKNKGVPFYDAVKLAAKTDKKCGNMLREIEKIRAAAVGRRTYEVIEDIFTRTYILEKVARYPDGESRAENMRLLMRYALEYEKNSYKGLFSFLQYLDRMDALDNSLSGVTEAKDERRCVRFMSVHKSKGLEFPVCFFVDAGRKRVDQDTGVLAAHRGLGVASKIRTDGSFRECKPLSYSILRDENHALELSEEVRVLYVALTRAKTHLFISACVPEARLKKMLTEVAGAREDETPKDLWNTPSTLGWMMFALRHQRDMLPLYEKAGVIACPDRTDCRFTVTVSDAVTSVQYGRRPRDMERRPDIGRGIALAQAVYPYERQTKLPVKLSVSEIKGMRQKDPDAEDLIKPTVSRRTPDFIEKRKSGAQTGNAVHKFMQFSDFKTLAAPDGIAAEMRRLREKEFLTARECELVDVSLIENFIRQPVFSEILSADLLEKEKRFLFSMPARDIFRDTDETAPVLVQGVLDCYFEKDGRLVILDYKTDRLDDPEMFRQRYTVQLKLYRRCLADLIGRTADKLYIYSFHLDALIEIS